MGKRLPEFTSFTAETYSRDAYMRSLMSDGGWLYDLYYIENKSVQEIADIVGVHRSLVSYHMSMNGIPKRTVSEARSVKKWGWEGRVHPRLGMKGEKSPNWKGGISSERGRFCMTQEWRKAKAIVWRRDKARCVRCHAHVSEAGLLHVHHIVSFKVVEKRCDPDNLVLLCKPCHNWTHSRENKNREYLA